jgi:hypothetical protein
VNNTDSPLQTNVKHVARSGLLLGVFLGPEEGWSSPDLKAAELQIEDTGELGTADDSKTKEFTRDYKQLHSEELYSFYLLPYY